MFQALTGPKLSANIGFALITAKTEACWNDGGLARLIHGMAGIR